MAKGSTARALSMEPEEERKSVVGTVLPATMAQELEETDGPQGGDEENGEQAQVEQGMAPNVRVPVGADPKAVKAAIERANQESQTVGGRPGPAAKHAEGAVTSTAQRVGMKTPLFDTSKMSRDELESALQRALTQPRVGGAPIAKAIRWNNGANPNVVNGAVVSPRDSGSISVYGFARRPLTLYAGQWVQLAHYLLEILHFVNQHRDEINEYVEQRLGNKSKELTENELQSALQLFCVEQSVKAEET